MRQVNKLKFNEDDKLNTAYKKVPLQGYMIKFLYEETEIISGVAPELISVFYGMNLSSAGFLFIYEKKCYNDFTIQGNRLDYHGVITIRKREVKDESDEKKASNWN